MPLETTKVEAEGKAKPAHEEAPEALQDHAELDQQGRAEPATEPTGEPVPERKQVRPEVWTDERRENIAKMYRERRDAENQADREAAKAAASGHQAEPSEGDEPGIIMPDRSLEPPAPEQPAEQRQPEQRAEPPQQKVKIVVNGREEFLPMDEVVRRAQLSTATEDRLEEAKRHSREARELLEEVRTMRGQYQPQQVQQGGQPPVSQPDPAQGAQHQRVEALDPAMLRQVAERIQVGETEEAVQALAEFATAVRSGQTQQAPTIDAAQVGRMVSEQLPIVHAQTEMTSALDRFQVKYPEVTTDKYLAQTGLDILAESLVEDLVKAGVPEQVVQPYRKDVVQLAHGLAALKRAGRSVPTFDDVLDRTGKFMEEKYNVRRAEPNTNGTGRGQPAREQRQPSQQQEPAPRVRIGTQEEIQARQDRKRAMPSQPRPSGVRTEPPAGPQPKTAQQIVAEMRKARGFPVNA